ncbi:2-amino-4-hydroxy-6-hydroxymethyldihydropteridine diphosphokinase [Roseiterribacter gracilis]|uniref:2-amino-4-hydroxy-6-hydroxymethyldihydropteridine pyrophosphokinase n=1 Tax=Roseiterribacter gracilis TaxID=2812848 RepID=A0A8S8XK10_9PROT|nr:7,8-dihydro-6-hydroxymethylpterin-pyrophosphokina se [Rhodospirillales bacterium TMPK1]
MGIYVALGANQDSSHGPARTIVEPALSCLTAHGVLVLRRARIVRTSSWPRGSGPDYINLVLSVATSLSPAALLETLHAVERSFGRVRGVANAPRTLDLDLLDYHGRVENGPPLLPHPRLADRAFVLQPLAELDPAWRHPVTGRWIGSLLADLPGDAPAFVT